MSPEREQLLDQNYALEQWPGYWGTGLKEACIVGMGSDIGSNIAERLEKDGWEISGTTRKDLDLSQFLDAPPKGRWDLLLIVAGTLEPIGDFFSTDAEEWERAVRVNALGPLRVLRSVWPARKAGATVVFFGGPNLSKDTPSYTAYRAGKALLASLVGTLNSEYCGTKFVMFDPGVVNTKIHKQSIKAGHRAANYQQVLEIVAGVRPSVGYDEMYGRLLIALGINQVKENEGDL